MKIAPLQLFDYHALKQHVQANRHYVENKLPDPGFESLSIKNSMKQMETNDIDGSVWQISLQISQTDDSKDVPYLYELKLIGLILARPSIREEKLETIVRANGTAMLFGVAREMIRNLTSMGPNPAIILPATNFIPQKSSKTPLVATKKATKKTTKKKIAAVKNSAKKKVAKKKAK